MKLYQTIAGPGFPFDEIWHRKLAGRSYDRHFMVRVKLANSWRFLPMETGNLACFHNCTDTGDHGADDPLVPVSGER